MYCAVQDVALTNKKKLNNGLFSTWQTQTKHEFEILSILLMVREEALATDKNK